MRPVIPVTIRVETCYAGYSRGAKKPVEEDEEESVESIRRDMPPVLVLCCFLDSSYPPGFIELYRC